MAGTASAGSRELDTALVGRIRAGDDRAFGELYDRWFDRVYDLALRITRNPATAGDVAQEAFLSAWQSLPKLENPDAFGGWLLRITRNRAFNTQRREQRAQAYDTETMAMIERAGPSPASAPAGFRVEDRTATADDPARATEDGEIVALVWEAVDALGERDAEVLDLTLRHGLTPAEVGEVVGANRNAANQIVHRARNRLKDAITARVLWRGGKPECGDLADVITAAGITRFGADAVRVTSAHAAECDLCSERQKLRLDPAAMFAAVPIVGAPVVLKQKAAHALIADGVPMGGSAHSHDPGAGQAGDSADGPRGDRDDGDGADGDGSDGDVGDGHVGDDEPQSGRRGRIAKAAVAVVVVALLAVVSIVALADTVDHGTVKKVAVGSQTDTSIGVSTTVAPTSPTSAIEPAPTDAPIVAPTAPPRTSPPPTDPPPTDPPPPAATASATISPSSVAVPPPYVKPNVPVLAWSTSGGASVTVTGPGFSMTSASGSAPMCPGTPEPWSTCLPADGTHTYVVTVRDAGGAVIATASATLTIT